MERAAVDKAVASAEQLDAARVEYADHVRTVGRGCTNCVRVFYSLGVRTATSRELAAAVRTVGETVERQIGSFPNVSEALRGVYEAALRPSPRVSRSTHPASRGTLPGV